MLLRTIFLAILTRLSQRAGITQRIGVAPWFGAVALFHNEFTGRKNMKKISHPTNILCSRRLLGRWAFGGAAALALAACGGGGGGDTAELDLRAAYDRVLEGMDHDEVNKAVGGAPLDVSDFSRGWSSGNQRLYVDFTKLISSGVFYVVGVQWKQIGGGELTKTFDPNTY